MNKVSQIRKSLGIRQVELAQMLGISKSALSMVENDNRKLPAAAVLKLGKLELKHGLNFKTDVTADFVGDDQAFRDFLEKKLARYIKLIESLEKRIAVHSTGIESASKRKNILQAEQELFEGAGAYHKRITHLVENSAKTFNRFHPAKIRILEFELDELNVSKEKIEKVLTIIKLRLL